MEKSTVLEMLKKELESFNLATQGGFYAARITRAVINDVERYQGNMTEQWLASRRWFWRSQLMD